jgi:enterochelin esterase-like enzyme
MHFVKAWAGAVLTAALVLATGVLSLSATTATGSINLEGTIVNKTFASKALKGTAHYSLYLPADYATSGKRYPVIYFLHGLPGNSLSYQSITQVAAALEASGEPAIIVGAQGARANDTDPEWLNWGPGRNWETATASELVSVVDHRYRTIAKRAGRMLIGISAGGYGATLIALHNPSVYSVVESWSGYFHATTPDGTAALELGSADADDYANAHKLLPKAKRFLSASSTPTYFAFYVGKDDSLFKDENLMFYNELRKAGISNVAFRVYAGGHNWNLWSEHAEAWLVKALSVAEKAQ